MAEPQKNHSAPERTTSRGFRIFGDFNADEGRPASVQVVESSAALRGPCVWVFHDEQHEGSSSGPALHLDYAGAKILHRALTVFLAEARADLLTEPMENIPEGSDG